MSRPQPPPSPRGAPARSQRPAACTSPGGALAASLSSLLLSALGAFPAAAQGNAAHGFDRAAVDVYTTGAVARTVGWELVALADVEVGAIGVFDSELSGAPQGGLASPKTVGLFDLSQNLLASATVPAGAGGVLCPDGYRYVAIPPTALVAGQRYVVAAWWPSESAPGAGDFDDTPDLQNSAAPLAFHSAIELVQPRYALGGGGLAFPHDTLPGLVTHLGAVGLRLGVEPCPPSPPADLVTTFASDNGFAGCMFDLEASHPDGVTIDAFQVNLGDVVPQSQQVEVAVYWRLGGYAGGTSSAQGWMLLGRAAVASWGTNQPTPVPVGGLALPAGQTVGVYVVLDDYSEHPPLANVPVLHYTGIGPAQPSYSDANLTLCGGVGKGAPAFSGPTIPDRMWNGGLLYHVGAEPFPRFCAGDGSGVPCPCANPGGADEGCAHGAGHGALLAATGSPSVAAGGPDFHGAQLPPGAPCALFQGRNALAGGGGLPFADGLRCVGGEVVRIEWLVADGAGAVASGVDVAAVGGALPGDVLRYQLWYRDAWGSPCGAGSNSSPGVEVGWTW